MKKSKLKKRIDVLNEQNGFALKQISELSCKVNELFYVAKDLTERIDNNKDETPLADQLIKILQKATIDELKITNRYNKYDVDTLIKQFFQDNKL